MKNVSFERNVYNFDCDSLIFPQNCSLLSKSIKSDFKQFFSKRSKFYGINLKECFISTFVQVENVSEIDAIFSNLKTFQIDLVIFGISRGL